MADSIARQPLRLGALLLLLLAVIAGLLFWQISHSDPVDSAADEGPIVEQAGTVETELSTTQPSVPGSGVAADPTDAGNADFADLAADAGSAFFIDFSGSPETNGSTDNPVPPPVSPDKAGAISGSVVDDTSPGGGTIPRISVYLARSDGVFTGATALTGDDGSFVFNGVPPGDYKLYFFDRAGTWRAAWYGGLVAPNGSVVSVGSGQEIRVVQGLKQGDLEDGAISGKVTDASGNGVAGVEARAFYVDEADGALLLLKGSAVTDSEGNYVISGLPTDKSIVPGGEAGPVSGYKVQFVSPGDLYSSQWYNGQPTHLTAKLLQLMPAEKLGGINAVMTGGSAKTANIATETGQSLLSGQNQPLSGNDETGTDGSSEQATGAEPADEPGTTEPADEPCETEPADELEGSAPAGQTGDGETFIEADGPDD